MDSMEFRQIILQFDIGLSNHWGYEEFKNRLFEAEDWAFENVNLLEKKEKLNVKNIYKQLYEFENLIDSNILETITKTRDEAIILAMLNYSKQKRPIIFSVFSERQIIIKTRNPKCDPETERIQSSLSKIVSVQSDLLGFYLQNSKTNEKCYQALYKLFIDYMENLIRLNKYEDYGIFEIDKLKKLPSRYDCGYIIHYLKLVIKHKDFELAKEILNEYPIVPTNKKEKNDYDKIKEKLAI